MKEGRSDQAGLHERFLYCLALFADSNQTTTL